MAWACLSFAARRQPKIMAIFPGPGKPVSAAAIKAHHTPSIFASFRHVDKGLIN
jgi:hypothetical protein